MSHRVKLGLVAAIGLMHSSAQAGPPRDRVSVEDARLTGAFEGSLLGSAADFAIPGLTDGIVVQLGTQSAATSAGRVYVPLLDRKTVALELRPISVRDEGYTLREQLADGSWRTVDPGPESTYTGTIAGQPDGYVAASWTAEGLLASVIFPDGERQWVQPLTDFVAAGGEGLHVVYRGEDTSCEGACGNESPPFAEQVRRAEGTGGVAGTCGGDRCVAQLAADADFEYFTARGSSTHATQDRIHAIVNVVNHQYVREVGITHVLTTVLVRTAEPDPYSSATSDTLLCEMITEWTDNQTAVTRDLAKLFTGREISGATVGQAANFGQICDNSGFCTAGLDNGAYCYTQTDFSAVFACQADNVAHEIGHLWGAHHCTCPNSTMNSSPACANTFSNSGGVTVAEIDAHADAVACLTALNDPPANDTCDDATILPGSGAYTDSNVSAGTDGGAINCGSQSGSVGGGRNDVFFRITPIANGTVSVDTCGSSFDTMLSIHTGCPATPANQITCNDDCSSGTCGLDSCVTFAGVSGTAHYIRVAGYAGASGSITLNVSGPFVPGNNACADASPIEDGTAIDGSVALASNDGAASCGSSSSNPDAWYTFTAGSCGGTLSVDACGTHDRLGQDTGMDTVLSLHAGCPGTAANQLICNDDASPACPGEAGILRDSRATAALTPNQTAKVRVSHFSTARDDGFFFLNADFTPALLAPAISAIPNDSHDCGDAYTGPNPTLTNPTCMNPVTWSLITSPTGMTISASTGVVTWPTPTIAGSPHTISIRATNSEASDDETWTLTVNRIAPLIVPIANTSHDCGSTYTGPTPLLASASCMLPITSWQLINGPPGMTINASTGVVSWPTPTIAGSPHTITIRATNSAASDDETWALTVNRIAPLINGIPNTAEACEAPFVGPTPSLTNALCMNPVVWLLDDGPTGMTINAATGVLIWPVPTPDSLNTIAIRATNPEGFDEEAWRLQIDGVAPIVVDIPNDSTVCGRGYTGPIPTLANEECVTRLTWFLMSGPANMTIDASTGEVFWPTPNLAESGIGVLIRATSDDGFDEEAWRVLVEPVGPVVTPIPDAQIPEFINYTGPTPAIANAACTTAVTWTLVTGPSGMTIDDESGVVKWGSPRSVGSPHTVTIRAANPEGFDNESWALTVIPHGCTVPCGDFDGSGLVDLFDFATFAGCFGATSPSVGCPADLFACSDLDGSGTIDLDDYSRFHERFGLPAGGSPPNCE